MRLYIPAKVLETKDYCCPSDCPVATVLKKMFPGRSVSVGPCNADLKRKDIIVKQFHWSRESDLKIQLRYGRKNRNGMFLEIFDGPLP